MNQLTDRFLDPPYEYSYERGPSVVRSHDDAKNGGLNCVALAHLAIHDVHGELLPANLQAYEMFSDQTRFRPVPNLSDMEMGDVLWFGLAQPFVDIAEFQPIFNDGEMLNWVDCPVRHAGVFTGEVEDGDPLVLHASRYVGACAVWPLSEFAVRPRYGRLYGIRRYQDENTQAQTAGERHLQLVPPAHAAA